MPGNYPPQSWILKVSGAISQTGLFLTFGLTLVVVPLTLWFGWTRNGRGFEALAQTAFCASMVWFLIATMQWSRSFRKLTGVSSAKLLFGPRPDESDELKAWRCGRRCLFAFLAMIGSMAAFALVLWLRGE